MNFDTCLIYIFVFAFVVYSVDKQYPLTGWMA